MTYMTNPLATGVPGDAPSDAVAANGVATGRPGNSSSDAVSVNPQAAGLLWLSAYTPEVTDVIITHPAFLLTIGDTTQLTAIVRDQHHVAMPDESVTWDSSDTDIATVDSSGVVTAVAEGDVTITATSVTDETKRATSEGTISAASWATRGIHTDALLYDHGGLYSGADDTAKTAALHANITTSAGGTGTSGYKYNDGVHGELAIITSDNTLDGHPVIRYTQPNATANTPQLWANLPRHLTGYWSRFKYQMPAGWTPQGTGGSDPGYKHFGMGFVEYDGRSSWEWTNGQQFLRYAVQSKSDGHVVGGVNEMTYRSETIPLASPGSTFWRDLIVCNYSPMAGFWRTLAWFAADGDEPVLILDQWAGMASGAIPTFDRIQLGINWNKPRTQDTYWDEGEWQIIDYDDNADPWGLIAAAGGDIDSLQVAGAMTVTNVSGTIDPDDGGTLILTGTGFNPSLPSYHFITLYDANGSDTHIAVDSFSVDSSTQITVNLTTGGAAEGTYHIGVQTVGITAGIPPCANTPPMAFSVAAAVTAPDAPTADDATDHTTNTLTFPVTFAATGGIPTAVAVQTSTDGGSHWDAHADIDVTGVGLGDERDVVVDGLDADTEYTVQFAAKNAAGTSDWSASVTGTTAAAVEFSIVQHKASDTPGTLTFDSPTGAGHHIGLVFLINKNCTVASVTDNAPGGSSTYEQCAGAQQNGTDGTGGYVDAWQCKSSRAGATTLTVTYTGSPPNCFMRAYESIGPSDIHGTPGVRYATGSNATLKGGSVTTSVDQALIIAIGSGSNTYPSITGIHAGNPFTNSGTIDSLIATAHLITSTAGTYQPEWDIASAADNLGATVAFA